MSPDLGDLGNVGTLTRRLLGCAAPVVRRPLSPNLVILVGQGFGFQL